MSLSYRPLFTFRLSLLKAFSLLFVAIAALAAVGCSGSGSDVSSSGNGGGGSAAGDITGGGGDVPQVDIPGSGSSGGSGGGGSGGGSGGGGSSGGGVGGAGGGTGGGGGSGGSPTPSVSVDPSTGGERVEVAFSGSASDAGLVQLTMAVSNTTSFQVVTQAPGVDLATLSLTDPSGTKVLTSVEPLRTLAFGVDSDVNSLPYPSRGADTPISAGSYVQDLLLFSSGADFAGSVIAKQDSDLTNGTLRVNVFRVGDDAQSFNTESAISAAIDLWKVIYANIGITLSVSFFDISSNTGLLPSPLEPSAYYLQQTSGSGVPRYAVNIFLGSSISADGTTIPGNEEDPGVLGISTSIPGPAIPTSRSAVAVNLTSHEGPDGAFSNDEIKVLAETMAHESGHYLGLFHPVEFSGSDSFTEGDPLGDTAVCTSVQDCLNDGTASNLMFPASLSGVTQESLTSDQGRVVNLQAIVD